MRVARTSVLVLYECLFGKTGCLSLGDPGWNNSVLGFKGRRFTLLKNVKQVRFRVLAVIMALMLALPAVPLAFAAPEGTAEFSVGAPLEGVPAEGLKAGDVITVPILLADNPGFLTIGVATYFDTAVFEYVENSLNRNSPSILLSFDFSAVVLGPDKASQGMLTVGAVYDPTLEGQCTSNGRLYAFRLRVKDNAPIGNTVIRVGIAEDHPANFTGLDPAGGPAAVPVPANCTSRTILIASDTPVSEKATINIADVPAQVSVGTTVTMPVTIEKNPGFASGIFQVNYNSTELQLINVLQSSATQSSMMFDANVALGQIFLSGITNFTSDAELFTLVFEVKGVPSSGISYVSISALGGNPNNLTNASGTPVEVDYLTGSVPIQSSGNLNLNIPGDLQMLAFSSGSRWDRVYTGTPQSIAIGLQVGGGTGSVTVYYDGSTTAPTSVGSYVVTITTSGVAGYNNITTPVAVGTFNITKAAAPVINWPSASAITYGQSLSNVSLNPTSNNFGTFAWDSSVNLSETPVVGTYSYPVAFIPSAETLANYEAITTLVGNVSVVVNKAAAPVIVWPTASAIRQGQTLSAATLSFASNEYGTFAWANASTIPAYPGGNFALVFVPSAGTLANYEPIAVTSQDVSVMIIRPGDVDGDQEITALDVMRIMQHAAAVYTLTGDALLAADVDGNGVVTTADAILAARIAIGLAVAP